MSWLTGNSDCSDIAGDFLAATRINSFGFEEFKFLMGGKEVKRGKGQKRGREEPRGIGRLQIEFARFEPIKHSSKLTIE